ncbi:hypothetical protein OG883_12165 [Streptomyces sp. NBC_01142]|uniref:hypothetical protein n=1 Tax=Streptomyces sp. NBC_01142 TaxID=2975865 RepID=UPI00225A92BC|nr:hypothetical protein [Streptomyces sp. NBC_01142]MCX4820650.1 hypothetical protein [Streptomyces sp. NBC_01142]
MSIAVEIVNEATDEVAAAVGRLALQLSSSAKPMDRKALARVIACKCGSRRISRPGRFHNSGETAILLH